MNQVQMPERPIECLNFCDGEWFSPSGPEIKVLSPYTNAEIGRIKSTTKDDLKPVVEKALLAQKSWGATPIKERAQVLFKFREILLRDKKQIAHQISAECGKTLLEAEAELMKGLEVTEFALSLQNLDTGGRMEVSRGVFCEYRREPLGVVAGITPFNFPSMVPLWMLPIAIALGNSFIWKPSDKTPLTSILIAKSALEAGLPSGVLNIVHGGKETVEAILEHPDIKSVGFVGSTPIAKLVYQNGTKNLKRVLALGGAKNHILLLPDAEPELTGKGVADSFTGCAGQRCMAASVLLAISSDTDSEERIEKLIDGIRNSAAKLKVGESMGAIISKESLERLDKSIAQAEKDGAQLVLDGRNPSVSSEYKSGNWLGPTILDHVKPGSHAATEELFGPVLSIVRCKSLSEALKIQSTSIYGNAVSVFTQSGDIAERVAKEGRAGMVGINIGVPVPREPFSFGGFYESKFGQGDITGIHSLDLWSDPKKVTTKWAKQKDSNWMS